MFSNNTVSPLENLAAFAVVFTAAVAGTIAFQKYIEMVRRDARVSAQCKNNES